MHITINARGYELALDFSKKKPGPRVFVSESSKIHVHDVAEMLRLAWADR